MDGSIFTLPNWPLSRKFASVGVLLFINLLNYMDRLTVAGVLTKIQAYFSINDSSAGLLQTAFIVFYMIFAPICGYFGDRYSRKFIIQVGLVVWMCAVLASTFVGPANFYLFMLCRGVVGIGEASYSTIAPTIIADMFIGNHRSTTLMVFYFAIPIGSGLGYITGSSISMCTGNWQWGLRVTPILGVIGFILLFFIVEEPVRGETEHSNSEPTPFLVDIRYLMKIPTYICSTIGSTAIIFVAGCLSWWTPTLIEHAWAMQHDTDHVDDEIKFEISSIFGLITCLAGIVGVAFGSLFAQIWRTGYFRIKPNKQADPHICAIGALVAIPFLLFALIACANSITLAWVFIFFGITCCCFNWAVNMDILMYIVVSHRRSTATAIQTLISHLFGDASSPYVIGFISDTLRGDKGSATLRFLSLQRALFIPTFMLVLGGAMYLCASFYIEDDRQKTQQFSGDYLRTESTSDLSPLVNSFDE